MNGTDIVNAIGCDLIKDSKKIKIGFGIRKIQQDKDITIDKNQCVSVEILTPTRLMSSRTFIIMNIAEKYPDMVTLKTRDILEKCARQLKNNQDIHDYDLIEIYNIAYSLETQINDFESL